MLYMSVCCLMLCIFAVRRDLIIVSSIDSLNMIDGQINLLEVCVIKSRCLSFPLYLNYNYQLVVD